MARRRRGRSRQGGRRFFRRHRRGASGMWSRFRGVFRKPVSHVIAPALGVSGLVALIFSPLPNGDSWIGRVMSIIANARSGRPIDMIGGDASGNNVFTILGAQLQQNVILAAPILAGAAIAGIVGRIFKV